MFDIGFSELLVIGLVALVVIGPERLPKVARTAGQWLGKLNRYVSQVKQDIDRDIKLDELRKMQQEMKETAQKYEILAGETIRRTQEEVTDAAAQVEAAVGQESAQISRVMQAMSTTDGGLAMQEYEKIKAEEAVAGSAALPAPNEPVPQARMTADAAEPEGVAAQPGVDPQPSAPKTARPADGSPDSLLG